MNISFDGNDERTGEIGDNHSFDPQPNHAFTFPFLRPSTYDIDDRGDATSQTSLLSRSHSPAPSTRSKHDIEDHELDYIVPVATPPTRSRFVEDLRPQRPAPDYHPPHAHKYVLWGVSLREPTTMVVFVLFGLTTAICHHFYNISLEGKVAGDSAAQQWVIWIGTGFSNSTVFFLNSAIGIALVQAIWFTVKRHALSVGTLDTLFGLEGDITGFINWELLKGGRIALLIAFIIWYANKPSNRV